MVGMLILTGRDVNVAFILQYLFSVLSTLKECIVNINLYRSVFELETREHFETDVDKSKRWLLYIP